MKNAMGSFKASHMSCPAGEILFVRSSLAVCQKFYCHEHCQHNQQNEVSCCPDRRPAMLNDVKVDSAPMFT